MPVVLAVVVLAAACRPPIGVVRMKPDRVHRSLTRNVLTSGEPSRPTRNVLFKWDLMRRFDDDPAGALAALHARVAGGDAGPDALFALAELSLLHSGASADRSYALAAAIYAWAFLFPDPPQALPDSFDPRFRLAADLYNLGLTSAFASPAGTEVELRSGSYALPFGTLEVEFDEASLLWGGRRLGAFVPMALIEVRGLPTRYRAFGLGAPLAARALPLDPTADVDDFLPRRLRVPVTALLRLAALRDGLAEGRLRGRLEIYPPSDVDHVTIDGRSVPLEVESTAALAAMLAEAAPWRRELRGFLRSIGAAEHVPRLVALEPYRPGLVPVVFVHGTASSAARWAQMVNEIANDTALRGHYQLWFFSYDTGNPIAYSAMLLREALRDAVRRLDPEGTDAALRRMVVVGHSQGGLLTKALVVESGTRFWDNVSDKPLATIRVRAETRALLERALFFEPLPFVRRVVFIATPHRGSYVAGSRLAQFVAGWVTFPVDLTRTAAELLRGDDSLTFGELPTSVDNMTPGNPFIRTMAALPVAPDVRAHSIIAVEGDGRSATASDGVVRYDSAHVEGVASELVVRSGHSCQDNPHTIDEVRRILRLHLQSGAPAPTPASGGGA